MKILVSIIVRWLGVGGAGWDREIERTENGEIYAWRERRASEKTVAGFEMGWSSSSL